MPYRRIKDEDDFLPSVPQQNRDDKMQSPYGGVTRQFTNKPEPISKQYSTSIESDISFTNDTQAEMMPRRMSHGTGSERDVDAPFVIGQSELDAQPVKQVHRKRGRSVTFSVHDTRLDQQKELRNVRRSSSSVSRLLRKYYSGNSSKEAIYEDITL